MSEEAMESNDHVRTSRGEDGVRGCEGICVAAAVGEKKIKTQV